MKKKILILLLLLISLCGCTKRFTIENEDTGKKKSYVSNIICKPESEELLKIYEENADKLDIKLDDLPDCKTFKIENSKTDGLWTFLFIKPLSWLIIKFGNLVNSYAISIMVIGLLFRVAMYPITKKSTNMSKNLKKAQKDLDALERKYKDKDDKDSMMMKSQEMLVIYKKYDVNPFSGCLFALIQTPLFLMFLEAVYRVPSFFEENFLVFNLGTTPTEGFAVGNYWYIILIVLIGLATYFSFKNMSNTGNSEQQKQTKMMSIFMLAFIVIVSFQLPTAIALYWIVSNGFAVVQSFLTKSKEN